MFHKILIKRLIFIFITALVAAGNLGAAENGVEELEWAELVPEGYSPDALLEQYQEKYNIDELSDDDPLITELQAKLKELWNSAPINTALNGKTVKLPGFVVPLEGDGQRTSEFLLVPYYGACIHVPPPPANQTVYVTVQEKQGVEIRKLFDTVWVTGVINAEKLSTDIADAGYTLHASKVEPYE
ncbi:DUF3299 domain-containing protein [Sedimenticola thiotaurini]|uniref:DUF3299 domain-containing protein n=1 Tax=Sedimenticola thiotaurini TaxID=1543721 RepID=UPI00069C3FB5|nr:DUF3299 domain-containing protein [Sedimenticola thiotaurini]